MTGRHGRVRGIGLLLSGLIALLCGACAGESQAPGPGRPQPWREPPTPLWTVRIRSEEAPPFGSLATDGDGGVWAAAGNDSGLWHFDREGRQLGHVPLSVRWPGPFFRAADGSFWLIDSDDRGVVHADAQGRAIPAAGGAPAWGRAVDLAPGPGNEIFVLDQELRQIVVLDADGAERRRFGRRCGGDCGFEYPTSLVVTPSGEASILDAAGARVKQYDADGHFIRSWAAPGGPWYYGLPRFRRDTDGSLLFLVSGTDSLVRTTATGELLGAVRLRKSCQFGFPAITSLAPLPAGEVMAIDCSSRLVRFGSDGGLITAFSGGFDPDMSAADLERVLPGPDGLYFMLDANGFAWELDEGGGRIRALPPGAEAGNRGGSFGAIAVDRSGNLLLLERYGSRIVRCPVDRSGVTDTLELRLQEDVATARNTDLAIDGRGRIVITRDDGQVRFYDAAGRLEDIRVAPRPAGAQGPLNQRFPLSRINLAPDGSLWGLDQDYRRFVRWDPLGVALPDVPLPESGIGEVLKPVGFAFGPGGYLDVLDEYLGRIYRFDLAGQFLFRWFAVPVPGDGRCGLVSLNWGLDQRLYVVGANCRRIDVFAY